MAPNQARQGSFWQLSSVGFAITVSSWSDGSGSGVGRGAIAVDEVVQRTRYVCAVMQVAVGVWVWVWDGYVEACGAGCNK